MEKKSTIQKLESKNNQKTVKNIPKSKENVEDEAENQIVKTDTPKKVKKVAKRAKSMIIPSIDPYDVPLKWWEKEHVKYAINYSPIKSRLEKIMGTHIVRITDHDFMLLLASKIRKDYEEQQMERIEQRKLLSSSVMSQLLKVSYKKLAETMQHSSYNKIKLYV